MSECSSTLRAFSQRDKLCVSENVFHGFSGQPHTLFASAKARDFKKFFTKNVLQLDIFLIQNNTVFKMPPNAFYDLALTMQSSRLNLHCRFYNPTICRKNLPSNSRFQFFESYDSDKSYDLSDNGVGYSILMLFKKFWWRMQTENCVLQTWRLNLSPRLISCSIATLYPNLPYVLTLFENNYYFTKKYV